MEVEQKINLNKCSYAFGGICVSEVLLNLVNTDVSWRWITMYRLGAGSGVSLGNIASNWKTVINLVKSFSG